MPSDIIKIVILAVIQGITEFLPISSSGHLVIFQHLLEFKEDNLYYTVVLHVGTLCSILVYYAKDLMSLFKERQFKVVNLVIVGTLPLILAGFVIKPILEKYFDSLLLVCACLILTAIMLLIVHKPSDQEKKIEDMRWYEALLIGLFQCVAVLPGVSRSGITISIGTRLGFLSDSSARFSFYLAIPAIAGAAILETLDLIKEQADPASITSVSIPLTLIGFGVSFAVGYYALKILIHTLKTRKFSYFGYYCLAVSIIVFITTVI